MTEEISGKIQNVFDKSGTKNDGTGWQKRDYVVNGQFFSTFNTQMMGFNKGDDVTIQYEKDKSGNFNNIVSIYPAGENPAQPQNSQPQASQSPQANIPLGTGNKKKKKYMVTVEEIE